MKAVHKLRVVLIYHYFSCKSFAPAIHNLSNFVPHIYPKQGTTTVIVAAMIEVVIKKNTPFSCLPNRSSRDQSKDKNMPCFTLKSYNS